jgi:hypothetical protein
MEVIRECERVAKSGVYFGSVRKKKSGPVVGRNAAIVTDTVTPKTYTMTAASTALQDSNIGSEAGIEEFGKNLIGLSREFPRN